jgi:hypothetical protein
VLPKKEASKKMVIAVTATSCREEQCKIGDVSTWTTSRLKQKLLSLMA